MSETLKDLLEYLQNKIDSGEHKIFYNDLGWDIKTIDCINAINEQQEEIERLNNIINELEKWLVEWREMLDCPDFYEEGIIDCINDTLTKLQELKGSDSNVKD